MVEVAAPVRPEADPASAQPAAFMGQAFSAPYRTYALVLLFSIYVINFIDRSIVNILAEPIKHDLHLSDTQIGLMGGAMFAIFYATLGMPIARLAERSNRPLIIATATAVWSAFTAVCGLAQSFLQLAAARIGVGVGEAGCTPPAHSLIVDYVPKDKRASALAFYSAGTPIGGLFGLLLGGLIADAYGWRQAFLVVGLPGLAFAILAALTLKEPRKYMAKEVERARIAASATFGQTLALLAKKRTFWFIAFAAAIKAFIGYGHAPFTASYFLRNHPDQIADLAARFGLKPLGFLGMAIGLSSGLAGAAGSILGGVIADKFGKNDLRAYMVAPAIASLITIPIYIFAITVDTAAIGLTTLMINYLLGTLWYGPVYATGQGIVPPHMRATAAAILLFVINLIGLGLGPLAVGMLSDLVANTQLAPAGLSVQACKAAAGGPGAAACAAGVAFGVRWALIGASLLGVFAFALFWMARKTIREEMES